MAKRPVQEEILAENLPPGAYVSILHRRHMIYPDRMLHRPGISSGRFPLRIRLSSSPDITREDLAEYFQIDRGTFTRTMMKREERGFVCRRTDPENRRRSPPGLTDAGEKIVPQVLLVPDRREEAVRAGFPKGNFSRLYDNLMTIAKKSPELAQRNWKHDHGTA